MVAVRTAPPELRHAIRTDDEIRLHAALAAWTDMIVFDVTPQIFFFQCSLIFLRKRLLGTHQEIQDQARQLENNHERDRENLGHDVLRARSDIAIRPDSRREEQQYIIDAEHKRDDT